MIWKRGYALTILFVFVAPLWPQTTVKLCFQRTIPFSPPGRKGATVSPELPQVKRPEFVVSPERIAVLTTKYWSPSIHLGVSFTDSTSSLQQRVMKIAVELESAGGICFTSPDAAKAQIKVTFQSNQPAWSYFGTDAINVKPAAPTHILARPPHAAPPT